MTDALADTAAEPATALLVIDVQRSFEHAPYWSERDVPEWRARLPITPDSPFHHGASTCCC